MNKPIGIIGGTFDPIHFGHLHSALEVLRILALEHIEFIPCKTPVHKELESASAKHRYAMLLLATEHVPQFMVNDCEITRDSPSYMVDTLQSLRLQHPDTPLCLILGTDSFMSLPTWHRYEKILELAHIIIMQRPGHHLNPDTELENYLTANLADDISELHESIAGKIYFQVITEINVSSTQIRQQYLAGMIPYFLTPESVVNYIKQHQLYQSIHQKGTSC